MDEKDIQLSAPQWEEVSRALLRVTDARAKLVSLRKQKTELRKLWSTYKYHNREKRWYIEIIYKLGADIKDANRCQDELGDKYLEYMTQDPEYADLTDEKKGIKIYNSLQNVKRDITDEIAIVGESVMDLWEIGLPLKIIAKAYGATENTTYIFITRQPRFKLRRDHPQSHEVDSTDHAMYSDGSK